MSSVWLVCVCTFKVVCVYVVIGGDLLGGIMGDARLAHAARSGPSPMKKGRCGLRRQGGKGRSSGGGRRWTTSQSLGLVNGCRMSMKKIGKRRGTIRRGLVTARTSYFLPYLLHLTYICPDVDIFPFFHQVRTVILVSGTSLAATRTFLHEMRGMRARKLITPRVEDEAAHHLPASYCTCVYSIVVHA